MDEEVNRDDNGGADGMNLEVDQITALSKSCYYHIRELRCIRPYYYYYYY